MKQTLCSITRTKDSQPNVSKQSSVSPFITLYAYKNKNFSTTKDLMLIFEALITFQKNFLFSDYYYYYYY